MRKNVLTLFILFFALFSSAQENTYMTGLLPDDGTYETLPRKAELISRDYQILPSSYSLIRFCPYAKSQGNYGTCTAWATTYAARTIAEAIKYNWTDRIRITKEAFSPGYTYARIKSINDTNCQRGTHIYMRP